MSCFYRRSVLGLTGIALLVFSGCERAPLPPPQGLPGLTVVVRPARPPGSPDRTAAFPGSTTTF
jgi:hypothetical protein